jgi:alpha-ketoglutarate-dependent taurine dioxygenase
MDICAGFQASAGTTMICFPRVGTVLRAIKLLAYGGTTVWANMAEACRRLHPALQALANGLRAVHSNPHDYAGKAHRSAESMSKGSSAAWSSRPSTWSCAFTWRPASRRCCLALCPVLRRDEHR